MNVHCLLAAVLVAAPASPPAAPAVGPVAHDYVLTASTGQQNPFPLDAGALVLGPTGDPTPAPIVVDYYWQHYLAHPAAGGTEVAAYPGGNDASGDTLAFTTPELANHTSYLDGDADVVHELLLRYDGLIAPGAEPLYLLGYSQSSTILTAVDSHLNDQAWLDYVLSHGEGGRFAGDLTAYADQLSHLGSIAPDLRLVLLGDPAADPIHTGEPAGWDNNPATQQLLNTSNMNAGAYGGGTVDGQPDATVSTLGADGQLGTADDVLTDGYGMAGQNTNLDLSPTAVYTVAGDAWAQVIIGFNGPEQGNLAHLLYPGLDASAFHLVDHVANVDYFEANPDFFQTLGALFNAGWLSFLALFS